MVWKASGKKGSLRELMEVPYMFTVDDASSMLYENRRRSKVEFDHSASKANLLPSFRYDLACGHRTLWQRACSSDSRAGDEV